jgi:predicted DCC family thiol-disulfide oxidoreductase YuxK
MSSLRSREARFIIQHDDEQEIRRSRGPRCSVIDKSIEVFFDGHCPLCRREMGWIRRRDRWHHLRFTDIAVPGFDAGVTGIEWPTLMNRIHARLPDGRMIEGVEVFRRIYSTLGFGPLVALTRLPGIRQALDLAYRWFARNRLRLAGRCKDDACTICPEPTRGQLLSQGAGSVPAGRAQPPHRIDGLKPPF